MMTQLVIPEHDLPDWIRAAKRGFDWGWVLVAVLSLAIGWSFVISDGLSTTSASANYGFRVYDTAQALRQGDFYPRWSPHALYGLGAPIPNFYPPLATYVPALLSVLLTNDVAIAVRIMYLVGFVLAGVATYSFVLHIHGARAGVLAALLYVYSPMMAFTLPHQYGDLSAFWGAALLPLFLGTLDRALGSTSRGAITSLAAVTALIVLADPLVSAPTAFMLGIALLVYRWQRDPKRILAVLLSFIAGMAISAFYWLPALLEANQVLWQRLDAPFTVPISAVSLWQPFAALDPAMLPGNPQNTLGLALSLTVVTWAGVALYRRTADRFSSLFMFCAAGTGVAAVVWQVPQLIAAMSLCVAIGVSSIADVFDHDTRQRRWLIMLVVGVLMLSLPMWISQRSTDTLRDFSPMTQLHYEQQDYGIAVLPQGALIPGNVALDRPPDAVLWNNYATGFIDRLTLESRSRDQVALLRSFDTSQRYSATTASALSATYTVGTFAGWQASLDNVVLPMQPLPDQTGYSLVLPATREGELYFTLGSTLARQAGWLTAVCGCLFVIAYSRFYGRQTALNRYPPLLQPADVRLLVLACVTCMVLVVLVSTGRFRQSLRPAAGSGLATAQLINYRTDTPLQLLAMQLESTVINPSQATLSAVLYWQASRPLDDNYKVSASLRSVTTGSPFAMTPFVLLGNRPSRMWAVGQYTINHISLSVPATLPPDRYTLELSVVPCELRNFACDESSALTFFDAVGIRLGSRVTLPRILTR